jgi:hypothetical protein
VVRRGCHGVGCDDLDRLVRLVGDPCADPLAAIRSISPWRQPRSRPRRR